MGLINSFSRLFRKKMDTDELMFNFLVIASSIIAQKDAWEYKTLAISFAQYIGNSQYKMDYEQADLVSKTARFICTYDELQKLLIDFNKSNLDISYYFQILDLLNALRSGILTELEFDSEDLDDKEETIATFEDEFKNSPQVPPNTEASLDNLEEDEELASYGITFEGKKYYFQSYKYDKRDDAIRYAKLVSIKNS